MTDTSSWNLNRLLVVLGALCTFAASFVFSNYSLSAWAAAIPQFVPAFPGWIFAIVLALYARPWVYLTSGILIAILPLMVLFLFGAITQLTRPILGGEYGAMILLLLGLVFALTGGIAGFREGRKGAHTPIAGALSTTKGLSMALVAALLVGVFLTSGFAGAAVKELATTGGGYDVAPDTTATLTLADFSFSPRVVEIPVGQLVELSLVNEDAAGHTFTYEAAGRTFDTFVPGDSTVKVLLRFDTAQEIHFWCKPHSGGAGDTEDGSMWGTIRVA